MMQYNLQRVPGLLDGVDGQLMDIARIMEHKQEKKDAIARQDAAIARETNWREKGFVREDNWHQDAIAHRNLQDQLTAEDRDQKNRDIANKGVESIAHTVNMNATHLLETANLHIKANPENTDPAKMAVTMDDQYQALRNELKQGLVLTDKQLNMVAPEKFSYSAMSALQMKSQSILNDKVIHAQLAGQLKDGDGTALWAFFNPATGKPESLPTDIPNKKDPVSGVEKEVRYIAKTEGISEKEALAKYWATQHPGSYRPDVRVDPKTGLPTAGAMDAHTGEFVPDKGGWLPKPMAKDSLSAATEAKFSKEDRETFDAKRNLAAMLPDDQKLFKNSGLRKTAGREYNDPDYEKKRRGGGTQKQTGMESPSTMGAAGPNSRSPVTREEIEAVAKDIGKSYEQVREKLKSAGANIMDGYQ
jgi:hypothetical protein